MMTSTRSRRRNWSSNSGSIGEGRDGKTTTTEDGRCRFAGSDVILCPQKLLDKLLMVCPNAEFCQEVLPRSDLQSHLINRCKGVITNCVNASIGCSFQSNRAALQRHLDECLYKDKGRLSWLSGSPQLLPPARRRTLKIYRGQSSLGISIVGGIDTPLVSIIVQEIFQNGAAYKDGRLQAGDQLLEVNGVDLRRVTHDAAVDAMADTSASEAILQLTIFRESSTDDRSPLPPPPPPYPLLFPSQWKNNDDDTLYNNDSWTNCAEIIRLHTAESDKSGEEHDKEEEREEDEARQRLSPQHHQHQQQQQQHLKQLQQLPYPSVVSSSLELQTMIGLSWPLEEWTQKIIDVTNMASDSLGISIAGGRFSCGYDVPIYVTNIQTNGSLALTGQIAKGDILLSINETSLLNLSHNEAAEVLKCSTDLNCLSLLVIRSQLTRFSRPGNFRPHWKFWLSLPCICYSTRTLTLERSESGSLGFAIVGGYETTSPSSASGMTSSVPIFVRSVVHNGPAARDGRLRSGDMIVAVNDSSLEGISHSDAVRLLTVAGSEESNASVTLTVVSWPGTPV